ncbi:MAG: alpha-amylase [SAR324 cluster bacterium]|uniref:Alpha-amylase n=1 Tax=SAR324 cluster bacterium TaxID=2024889 RepID=A0A7X9FRX9_9DELT|nr:alpha-amylase [SAR324 cluster bacterium]
MSSVVLYFQVHQPYRLRRYSYFEISKKHDYFNDELNAFVLRKVAAKCYIPANRVLLRLIRRYQGAFRVAFSLTGLAIEQMERYAPEALDSFVELAQTGCVEFLGETYYHSLAALYDRREFVDQVQRHAELMENLFHYSPKVFRNTELIYSNEIGVLASQLGYKAVIAEGVDEVLGGRSPNHIYTVPGIGLPVLMKNYGLSDDIAFRFSNQAWHSYPLTAPKFASWVHQLSGQAEILNLFMDYETFGEHQWEATGIFEFLEHLPGEVMQSSEWDFDTPSGVVDRYGACSEINFPRLTSWADLERDLSAWRGNRIQTAALGRIYSYGKALVEAGNAEALHIWRLLQTSDHFYYMCTKMFEDGDVHSYFSPYESPYDAFIYYMNILRDFELTYLDKRLVETIPTLGVDEINPSAAKPHQLENPFEGYDPGEEQGPLKEPPGI